MRSSPTAIPLVFLSSHAVFFSSVIAVVSFFLIISFLAGQKRRRRKVPLFLGRPLRHEFGLRHYTNSGLTWLLHFGTKRIALSCNSTEIEFSGRRHIDPPPNNWSDFGALRYE